MDLGQLLGRAAENLFKAFLNGLIFAAVATPVATYLVMRFRAADTLKRALVVGAVAGGVCGLAMVGLSLFA